MSLNDTPSGERIQIGIFGRTNVGKSSLINAITSQDLAIVSDHPGTTTDPVSKSMELLPLGPVTITDTPGLDDSGDIGQMRVNRAYDVLTRTDVAILVTDGLLGSYEELLIGAAQRRGIPYLVVHSKSDLINLPIPEGIMTVSSKTGQGIEELKACISSLALRCTQKKPLVSDLIKEDDIVLLVVPIDASAPKGRLILPQQQVIRDLLDHHAMSIVVRDTELEKALGRLKITPALVVCDSQVFDKVAKLVPDNIPLTSFSILFARYKGDLDTLMKSVSVLSKLQDGDSILISEGCTHHRQCGDIGSVKIPHWLNNYTGKRLKYSYTSGKDFPTDTKQYKLIVHCGGCMLNNREMKRRLDIAASCKTPIINYGVLIAHMRGILQRSTEVFKSRKDTHNG